MPAVPILKRPLTPPTAPGMVDYQSPEHEQLMKRLRPPQSVEEVILWFFALSRMPVVIQLFIPHSNVRLLIRYRDTKLLGLWKTCLGP